MAAEGLVSGSLKGRPHQAIMEQFTRRDEQTVPATHGSAVCWGDPTMLLGAAHDSL